MHSTKSFYCLFLLVHLSQIILTPGISFEYQLRCPHNQKDWEERSGRYICDGDKVYHCMQDQEGRYVTFCAKDIWIEPGMCFDLHLFCFVLYTYYYFCLLNIRRTGVCYSR
jgi:hypothetical protein